MRKSLCAKIAEKIMGDFNTKVAQKNYYDMSSRFGLQIDKKDARELIKSTHGFSAFWKYSSYAVSELIEDCQNKMYQGEKAFGYINSNFKKNSKKNTKRS